MWHVRIGGCKSGILHPTHIEFNLFFIYLLLLKFELLLKKKKISHVSIFHPTLNGNDHFDTRLKGWGLIWHSWKVMDQFDTKAKGWGQKWYLNLIWSYMVLEPLNWPSSLFPSHKHFIKHHVFNIFFFHHWVFFHHIFHLCCSYLFSPHTTSNHHQTKLW